MARDLNRVMLIGRLAADPELRTTKTGQTVANFRVATGRQWKDAQGQLQSQTEFTQIVAWGKLGDLSNQYLRKGRQVYVDGRLQTRSWVDKQNQKQWRTEVVAENVIFLGAPAADASTGAAVPASTGVDDVPLGTSPEPGTPQQPKVPANVTASGDQELEEIRIEDIPF